VHRRASGYVDRILKSEKPADLPGAGPDQVRAKTAKSHGPQIPDRLLALADEAIE